MVLALAARALETDSDTEIALGNFILLRVGQ
jgi:hypothetical protein